MVAINELEIQKAAGKLRVATYGRGVWESPLASSCASTIPVADFSASTVTICANQSIIFTNNSTNCSSTYAWTFPGGSPASSTATSPTVTYTTPGTYAVTLTVTTPGGADTKTISNYITVNTNLTHQASISSPNANICEGQTASFTLSNQNPGTVLQIEWRKNGVLIPGTNGLTAIVLSGLANGDQITAQEISSLSCASPSVITTNSITVNVSPIVTHSF